MSYKHFGEICRFLSQIVSCVLFFNFSDNNMEASKDNLSLKHQAGDFEPVYIKQEEGTIPSSAFATMKSEDKVKLLFLLQ